MKSLKTRLQDLVDTLPKKRLKDADWITPDPKVFQNTCDLIEDLLAHLFGTDYEDSPVVIASFFDRTICDIDNFEPIPLELEKNRWHPFGKNWDESKHTPKENEERNSAVLRNQSDIVSTMAFNSYITHIRENNYLMNLSRKLLKDSQRPEEERGRRIEELESLKIVWLDPKAWAKNHGQGFDAATNTIVHPRNAKFNMSKPNNFVELMTELETLKNFDKPTKKVTKKT